MRLLGIILLFFLFYGCSKEKLKAPDAFFLKPNSVDLAVTSSSLQGSTSSKITDLFLYVNGNYRGAYPTGNILPVTSYGPTEITLYAGIKNNGISTTRVPYEFYELIRIDTTVDPNTFINRDLLFKYKSNVKFHLNEMFDGGTSGISFKKSNNSDTNCTFESNPDNMLEGTYMFFGMDDTRKLAQFQTTSETYPLPIFGAPVYLELNFKGNQPFEVGVYRGADFRTAVTVNSSETWNKIYVNLTSVVSTNPYGSYGLFIKAVKSPDVENPRIYIDNVKLLSY